MATTTNYGWVKPTVGGDNSAWGTILNTLFDAVDSGLKAIENLANARLPLVGGTLTGRLDTKTSTMAKLDKGNEITTTSIDLSIAQYFTFTLTGATSIVISNTPPASVASAFILRITNGGAFAITWPGTFKWVSGTAPTLTAAGVDMLGFITDDGGATWRGIVIGKDIR